MTILEKLNLEPGAVSTEISRYRIKFGAVGGFWIENQEISGAKKNRFMQFSSSMNGTLTNAEFLAACEEWLSKN